MKTKIPHGLLSVFSASLALLFGAQLSAQPVLTNVSLYETNAAGSVIGGSYWDQLGPNSANNIYVFNGSLESPTWLNSGNTDLALNPNYAFSTAGDHVLYFTASSPLTGYLGMNLWFDNNRTNNRITAVAPIGGSTFSVVEASATTYDQASITTVPSSGSLVYATATHTVTLSGFSVTNTTDRVGATSILPDTYGDILATATFTVTAVPEPAHFAAIAGLMFLLFACSKRFRRQ